MAMELDDINDNIVVISPDQGASGWLHKKIRCKNNQDGG